MLHNNQKVRNNIIWYGKKCEIDEIFLSVGMSPKHRNCETYIKGTIFNNLTDSDASH